jgi:hypothetical protein
MPEPIIPPTTSDVVVTSPSVGSSPVGDVEVDFEVDFEVDVIVFQYRKQP